MENPLTDAFNNGTTNGKAWAQAAIADAAEALKKSNVTSDPSATLQNSANTVVNAATNAASTAGAVIKNGATAAGNMASRAWDATSDFVGGVADKSHKMGEQIGNSLMKFGKNLSPTGVITGLLGVGGAFLIGSAFGGSFSWVIAALLAPMMFLLGNQFGKDSVEPWISSFADGSSKSSAAVGRQRQQQYAPHAAAPVVQQRGFNTTRADANFGQQLVDGGFYPPQSHAYANNAGAYYPPQPYSPPVSFCTSFLSGNFFSYPPGWFGNRQWNSYPGSNNPQWQSHCSIGPQWQSHGSNAPQWQSHRSTAPQWQSHGSNNPQWQSGGMMHNPPAVNNNPPTQYIPNTIGGGGARHR